MFLFGVSPIQEHQNRLCLTWRPPRGINRRLDKMLENKILRGNMLFPDYIYRSQSPTLQIWYKDFPRITGFPTYPGYIEKAGDTLSSSA